MNTALSVYQVPIPTRLSADDAEAFGKMNIPPAGYIPLDHSILDFLDAQVSKNINHGFQVINIDVADEQAQGDETATGRAIDREEQHSFLIDFSANLFNLFEFSINAIGEMRYMDKWQPVEINPPTTFDLRKPNELTEEITNAPSVARRMLLKEFGQNRFGSSTKALERYETLLSVDSYAGRDEKEVLAAVTGGLTPKWKYYLHQFGDEFLDKAIEQNDQFFTLPMNERRDILHQLAKAFDGEVNPPSLDPNSLLNGLGA
jgi:hypothetical protein